VGHPESLAGENRLLAVQIAEVEAGMTLEIGVLFHNEDAEPSLAQGA
jgi:hypothetical protein